MSLGVQLLEYQLILVAKERSGQNKEHSSLIKLNSKTYKTI